MAELPALALQTPPDMGWRDPALRPGRRRQWLLSGPAASQLRDADWRGPVFVLDSSPGGGLLARGRILAIDAASVEVEILAVPPELVNLERLLGIPPLADHPIFGQPPGLFFPLGADQARILDILLPEPERQERRGPGITIRLEDAEFERGPSRFEPRPFPSVDEIWNDTIDEKPKGGFSVGGPDDDAPPPGPEPKMASHPDPPPPPGSRIRMDGGGTAPSTDMSLSVEMGAEDANKDTAQETEGRRFQTALYATDEKDGERLPADRPLELNTAYALRVGIDARDWGLGKPGRSLDEDLDDADFERHGGLLPLRVAIRSTHFDVSPALQGLDLPTHGLSPTRDFRIVPRALGRGSLEVDLLFEGRLLRTRRVEVHVVAGADDPVPETAWPVQDAWDVFEGIAELSPEAVKEQPRRRLSITVERDGELIGLRVYRWDGKDLGFAETRLTPQGLGSQLDGLREGLARAMDDLTGGVGLNADQLSLLTEILAKLASVGRSFRRNLLRRADELEGFTEALDGADVVQVAPLSTQVGVPWEMLYDRPIETWREQQSDRIRPCPSLAAGDLPEPGAACPSCGDAKVVCPNGFWGFRRVIEQLPYRRGRRDAETGHLPSPPPRTLGADLPIRLDACTFRNFGRRQQHLENLGALAPAERWTVVEASDLDSIEATLRQAGERTDLLYFYAHGGVDEHGRPYVKIGEGKGAELIENDFEAWEIDFHDRRPLVILNICDSAHYSPASFENLVQLLADLGASGVIATQCDIREMLADAMAKELFSRLLDNEPVGPALLASRRALLARLDPRGLVYSLFAESELQFANASGT